jgi:hypothetical protein
MATSFVPDRDQEGCRFAFTGELRLGTDAKWSPYVFPSLYPLKETNFSEIHIFRLAQSRTAVWKFQVDMLDAPKVGHATTRWGQRPAVINTT